MSSRLGKNLCVTLTATILSLAVAEVFLRLASYPPSASRNSVYRWDDRYMLFSNGPVFENQPWGGWTYKNKHRFRSVTFYADPDAHEVSKEYDYVIETNNYGLVQKNDIDAERDSWILLGDSFTEGQGARPWFYGLESEFTKHGIQLINGGLIGTGIEQFLLLYKNLPNVKKIKKALVIYTSGDWNREVWQFPEDVLACNADYRLCRTGLETFFALPKRETDWEGYVTSLAQARAPARNPIREATRHSKLFLVASQSVRNLKIILNLQKLFENNKSAAKSLIEMLGNENVLFLHLPQKDEIPYGLSPFGSQIQGFLTENRYHWIDGFATCGLTVDDYHKNDGHPTSDGYEKIKDCVKAALIGDSVFAH